MRIGNTPNGVQGMRHNNQTQGQKRGRNRNNNRRGGGGGNNRNTFDSNGPNVRIRGSASQIYDKYAALARDATSSGDRVLAESLFQHAEHYYRLANPLQDGQTNQRRFQQSDDESDSEDTNDENSNDNSDSDSNSGNSTSGYDDESSDDVVVIDTTPKNVEEPSDDSDSDMAAAASQSDDRVSGDDETPTPPKRGRGRPRKAKAVREPQTPAELAEAVAEQ